MKNHEKIKKYCYKCENRKISPNQYHFLLKQKRRHVIGAEILAATVFEKAKERPFYQIGKDRFNHL